VASGRAEVKHLDRPNRDGLYSGSKPSLLPRARGDALSRIWNLLKEVEKKQALGSPGIGRVSDRRSGERLWLFSPILVYGRAIDQEPFHESTEALHVNAAGGLITLIMPVRSGQRLLLFNKFNQREQECYVVCERSRYLRRAAIAIKLSRPAATFWGNPH
jgi:hypothetical protein